MGIRNVENSAADAAVIAMMEGRTAPILHLTHNDLDGVGSDAIHRMDGGSVMTIFSSVATFPRFCAIIGSFPARGGTLSITDLGYQKGIEGQIAAIKAQGWRIEWRDHHRWTPVEEGRIRDLVDQLTIDTGTCGCGICAREIRPGSPTAAEVARVVCDYDLWRNEDPRSAILGIVLQRKKNREYVRDRLVKGIFTDERIEREYLEIQEEMHRVMKRSISRAHVRDGRYRIVIAPLFGYPSETAHHMRDIYHSDMEILVSPNGRFSLRSVPGISHLVSREFGGGGHPNAAGGSFEFTLIERFLFWLFRMNGKITRFVDVAESY